MNLEDIDINLKKIQCNNPQFIYTLGDKATDSDFEKFEEKFGLKIPEKIKVFFKAYNGLITKYPDLKILSVSQWEKENSYIHFATFDKNNKIYFDSEQLNSANQWTIINTKSKYELTFSMSSFWSNKIWHWLRNRNKIWDEGYWN